MQEIIGFKDLKVGQRVKAKGRLNENGIFAALEISVQPSTKDHSSINGPIQRIDYEKKTIGLLGRDLAIQNETEILDAHEEEIKLQDLKPGAMVKVKYRYSTSDGFNAMSIKIKDEGGFQVEKVQGNIERVDLRENTLQIDGFTVEVNGKTMIESSE